ncbi:hypothetical protein ACFWPH_32175 [Nocardia sp. NPDC058499]|uniref:hypothetical protein n=1 Tax=Nocardia sp. NPDC058499 TaxID=3346530 RepID=UPI00366338EA
MKTHRIAARAAAAVVAVVAILTGSALLSAPAASAEPGEYRITSDVPTLAELNAQIRFLVATSASDEAKAANLEGGMDAVVVPRTVYRLGLFRAPLGSSEVTGPETHTATEHTAMLRTSSSGRPALAVEVTWKRIDGTWKLANSSLCAGVDAVGLSIPCTF